MQPIRLSHDLVVIRHGQTAWNAVERLQGRDDIPLNDTGRAQARRNGEMLRKVIAAAGRVAADYDWLASPLSRAAETMRIVRGAVDDAPADIRHEAGLVELDFGRWSGLHIPEIHQVDPAGWTAREADRWNARPPGGESHADAIPRIAAVLSSITRPTVIVTHGGANRVIQVLIGAATPDIAGHFRTPQDRIFVWSGGAGAWH